MSIRDNAWQMAAALSKNEISAVELANQHYEQIQAVDKDVHAFLYPYLAPLQTIKIFFIHLEMTNTSVIYIQILNHFT